MAPLNDARWQRRSRLSCLADYYACLLRRCPAYGLGATALLIADEICDVRSKSTSTEWPTSWQMETTSGREDLDLVRGAPTTGNGIRAMAYTFRFLKNAGGTASTLVFPVPAEGDRTPSS